jgi:hypothetical protein
MNILYLNHYAGSPTLGMEYRPYYLAREWVRAGHRVQVVAADHSHVRALQPAAGDEVVDGIAYHWVRTPPTAATGRGGRATCGPSCRRCGATPTAWCASSHPRW